ncbi:MAG: 4Fe-4S dicluster domain-containing protein [Planctomycetes bacterium]|nr:4Fe-4S dicluster domain-containing protein [Planctomycetota bacterium]
MNPVVTAVLLIVAFAAFAVSVRRRWRLLMIGSAGRRRFVPDRVGERARGAVRFVLGQTRLTRYRGAGLAHEAIFFAFVVLLVRSLILFARGFVGDPGFGYWILDGGTPLGNLYGLIKDVYVVLAVLGALTFLYLRLVVRPHRMTLNAEGILILVIILVMMVADVVYDGAAHVLAAGPDGPRFNGWEPLGSVLAGPMSGLPAAAVGTVWHLAFWTHVTLVLVFLNILPYSKHFHIITVVPNVFLRDLGPRGRLVPIDDLEGRVEREETLGVRRIEELSPKSLLDLYTCTECGRCTDQCPAARTGKLLSPKQLVVDLRDHLYENQAGLTGRRRDGANAAHESDLVPAVVDPETLWACTTCGACEEECPVLIDHVERIVDLRRHLVQEKGEFPGPLQEAFGSIEAVGSPYGVSADERMAWADGLEVPIRGDTDDVEILFWVGCAPATDDRAKRISSAVAQLLNRAGVRWAVLGAEESCTGDVARRAGNEYLFQAMAEANIEILDGYDTKRILTACPHCYNTLKHEYPDFGGHYEVAHHADFLAGLIADGRLVPRRAVEATVVYHDSCYLGRLNGVYASPREVLERIPGVTVVEAAASRDRGMCCGAGGGQMFKEDEPGDERISVARTRQLVETGADTICTACPFCLRMLTDASNLGDQTGIRQLDIAEVLWQSIRGEGEPEGASSEVRSDRV